MGAATHTERTRLIETDVLVVGSGLAGVMAAMKAARMGCKVVLISKVSLMSGNSIFAGGGLLAPSGDFTPDDYFRLVMEGGKQLNDPTLVRVLAQRGGAVLRTLEKMGVSLEKRWKKYWYVRTGTSSKYPGVVLMDELIRYLREHYIEEGRITALPWVSVIELVLDEGRIPAALGLSRKEGMVAINAKSIILATGGAGGIYKRNDNHGRITGDGYSLALRAGLALKDMEFVQFYPIGLAEPSLGSVIIHNPIPKEARFINARGEDILEKYDLKSNVAEFAMECRDQFTLILTRELEKGIVYMDCTRVPAEKWEKWFLNRLARINPDFRGRPFSIAPVVHFLMGGIEIDERSQTAIPGLFAAGEVTAGVHGANREGGNALTECMVFGDRAGESAARYAMGASGEKFEVERFGDRLLLRNEREEESNLFGEIQDLTWTYAGPIRNAESLEEGLSRVSELERRVAALEAEGRSVGLNEVKCSLLVSKAIMRASLERQESRGAFYREDFPDKDDTNWLKNILLELDRETGDLIISHQPVGNPMRKGNKGRGN
jgi:succinate dehydrogenase/fumarate reductase flavoprotein subunit